MTEREEQRIFTGPWPSELTGIVIGGEGILIANVPPMDRSTINQKVRERRKYAHDVREDVYEETQDLSHSELRATIEMARDELALRWAKVKELGEKVQERFEGFKDWIAEGLQEPYRDDPIGPQYPFSSLLHGYVRIGHPRHGDQWIRGDQWTHVKAHSHVGTDSGMLERQIQTFNRIAGRYRYLRTKRMVVAIGGPEPDPEEYTPSRKPKRLLQAVAKLDEEKEGLAEAESKTAIYRLAHARLNGGEVEERATKRLNGALRRDMERGGFLSQFPETPEELVELARTLSQRWDNVVPLSEPER